MISLELFIGVVIILLIINVLTYKYGVKKQIDAFMELLFIAGLMGKVDAFRAYNQNCIEGGSVFVGDSITQDFNVYEYFHGHNVYNRGIGGDTSEGVLTRLNESIFDLKPRQVFLQIGTNDFCRLQDGIEGTYVRIQEIIKQIKSFDQNIEIFLISLYPVNPLKDRKTVGKRNNLDIQKLNKMLETIQDVQYLDLYTLLEKDGVLNPDYTIEGLHLNQKGYKILKDTFGPYLH